MRVYVFRDDPRERRRFRRPGQLARGVPHRGGPREVARPDGMNAEVVSREDPARHVGIFGDEPLGASEPGLHSGLEGDPEHERGADARREAEGDAGRRVVEMTFRKRAEALEPRI